MLNQRLPLSAGLGSHSAFSPAAGTLVNLNDRPLNDQDIICYDPFGAFRGNADPGHGNRHSHGARENSVNGWQDCQNKKHTKLAILAMLATLAIYPFPPVPYHLLPW